MLRPISLPTFSLALLAGLTLTLSACGNGNRLVGGSSRSNRLAPASEVPFEATVTPSSGATNVPFDVKVKVVFNKPIPLITDPSSTVDGNTFLTNETVSKKPVPGTFIQNSFTEVLFAPATALKPQTSYTILLRNIKSSAGETLSTISQTFTTSAVASGGGSGDTEAPDVAQIQVLETPVSLAGTRVGVSRAPSGSNPPALSSTISPSSGRSIRADTDIIIRFTEALNTSTITTSNLKLTESSSTGTQITGRFSFSSITANATSGDNKFRELVAQTIATFSPNGLKPATVYVLQFLSGLQDSAGNALNSTGTVSFTTESSPLVQASLDLTTVTPANSSANKSVDPSSLAIGNVVGDSNSDIVITRDAKNTADDQFDDVLVITGTGASTGVPLNATASSNLRLGLRDGTKNGTDPRHVLIEDIGPSGVPSTPNPTADILMIRNNVPFTTTTDVLSVLFNSSPGFGFALTGLNTDAQLVTPTPASPNVLGGSFGNTGSAPPSPINAGLGVGSINANGLVAGEFFASGQIRAFATANGSSSDISVIHYDNSTGRLFLVNQGTPGTSGRRTAGTGPSDISAGDLENTSVADDLAVITKDQATGQSLLQIFANNGLAVFTQTTQGNIILSSSATTVATRVLVSKVQDTGGSVGDIIVAVQTSALSSTPDNELRIFYHNHNASTGAPTGSFGVQSGSSTTPHQTITLPQSPATLGGVSGLAAVDIDGDSDLDLAVVMTDGTASTAGRLLIFRNLGKPTGTEAQSTATFAVFHPIPLSFTLGLNPVDIAVGNLGGLTTAADIIIVNTESPAPLSSSSTTGTTAHSLSIFTR